MMKFSKRSLSRLESCHPLLQLLMTEAIQTTEIDFTVLCGQRNREEQDRAYVLGNSLLKWPNSKHNSSPSLAVDIAPYPVDWNDTAAFIALSHHIKQVWSSILPQEKGDWELSYGGDWSTLKDLPHWELRKVRS